MPPTLTTSEFAIFAGTANDVLGDDVARTLGVRLASSEMTRFPDGEISVRLLQPVRRKEVFIVQPTSPPVNEHLVELFTFVDASRRAAAAHITAIIPYFGYGRADKRHGRREAITASMVAELLQCVGVDHVITVDAHAAQMEGFFRVPVDSLTAVPTICRALKECLPHGLLVVSPDAGRMRMAAAYAERLESRVVVLHKRRANGAETAVTHVVGDVRDQPCLIIDDMITTGGTVVEAVEALRRAGARSEIFVAATHGLLVGSSRERLEAAGVAQIYVTDTVAVKRDGWRNLTVVSIAPLLASAIGRFIADGSLSDLF